MLSRRLPFGCRPRARGSATFAVALFAAACTGVIGPGNQGGSEGAGGPSRNMPGGSGTTSPNAFVPAPASLRRLTTSQYWNSVDDLFGPGAPRTDLDPDLVEGGFSAVGASVLSTSPSGVQQYETSALEVSQWAVADANRRSALVGCQPAGPMDSACAQSFLSRFGRLAFRRPLVDSEVNRYLALFATAADFWSGIQLVVAGMLESPKFLYRDELGVPSPANPSQLQVQGYPMASRLSYFLWGTQPDDALLDAAGQGDALSSQSSISAQVTRMLASPKARAGLRQFFYESLDLQDMGVLGDPTLASDLHEEALSLVDDIVFSRNAAWEELFTSTYTFLNQEPREVLRFAGAGRNGIREGQSAGCVAASGLLRARRVSRRYVHPQPSIADAARKVRPVRLLVPGRPAPAGEREHDIPHLAARDADDHTAASRGAPLESRLRLVPQVHG